MNNTLTPLDIIIGGLERGGTQRNCVNIANMLSAKGHEVKITTVRKVNNFGYLDELDQKVNLNSLNHKKTITAFISLIRVIKNTEEGSTILIMNNQLLPIVVFIAKLMGKKNKILFRNMNYISKSIESDSILIEKFFLKYLMMLALPFVDVVIHQCKDMSDDFNSFFIFQPRGSVVINNVLSSSQKKPLQKINHEPYLLLVGKLLPQKNIKFAIDILNLFHKKHNRISLLIIGKGKLLQELKTYAKEKSLCEYVKFLGKKNNVNDYYSGAYATILTSDYEGFPNVLIESISCGTPVVAHNCKSGPRELIINGKNGFLVDYQNILEFVDALFKIKDIDRSNISSTIKNYLPNNVYSQYSKII
tara:strand:+ start:3885 stop:4967 length:1083 start_codon:yes stop_codon:yes gene_type:complete